MPKRNDTTAERSDEMSEMETKRLEEASLQYASVLSNAIRLIGEWSAKCGAAEKERDDAIAAVRKLRAALTTLLARERDGYLQSVHQYLMTALADTAKYEETTNG